MNDFEEIATLCTTFLPASLPSRMILIYLTHFLTLSNDTLTLLRHFRMSENLGIFSIRARDWKPGSFDKSFSYFVKAKFYLEGTLMKAKFCPFFNEVIYHLIIFLQKWDSRSKEKSLELAVGKSFRKWCGKYDLQFLSYFARADSKVCNILHS